jgi:hypothetical protein
MGIIFSSIRFIGQRILGGTIFISLLGHSVAYAESVRPISLVPDQNNFPNAWIVLIFLGLVVLEAWYFYHTWKHRAIEEKEKPKVLPLPQPPFVLNRTPTPKRKRAAKEREKTLV